MHFAYQTMLCCVICLKSNNNSVDRAVIVKDRTIV